MEIEGKDNYNGSLINITPLNLVKKLVIKLVKKLVKLNKW